EERDQRLGAALGAAVTVQLRVEARALGQHVRRKEVLPCGEPAHAAVLQRDLHFAFQDEDPLRPGRAVKFAPEADRALAQLVAGGRQHGRQARFARTLGKRDALLAEFRTAVVVRVEHGLREDGFSVHSLLRSGWHSTMEVNMKFTALVAALALAFGSALVTGCDRDASKSASGGATSSGATSSPSSSPSGTSGSTSSSASKKSSPSPSSSPTSPSSSGSSSGSK